jgi:hypothetical protein
LRDSSDQAHDLHFLTGFDLAALNPARGHGAAARDGEDVLNRHEERLVDVALRGGDILVDGSPSAPAEWLILTERKCPPPASSEGLQSRTSDDTGYRRRGTRTRVSSSRTSISTSSRSSGSSTWSALFIQDNDVRHAYLTGKQDVLASLRHGAVGGGNYQNRTVHLSGTGDHVLNIVGVSGAVYVGVVPVFGLVLHVGSVDGDTALALFGSLVDHLVIDTNLGRGLALQSTGSW